MIRLTRPLMAFGVAGALLVAPASSASAHDPVLLPALPASLTSSTDATDDEAAEAAASWLADQLQDGAIPEDTGGATIDTLLMLVAAGGHDDAVAAAGDWLAGQAESYAVDNGPAAGKLAIAAAALGLDPSDFGGVDLPAQVQAQTAADGTCGEFGSAFGNSLCILGLVRADAEVDPALVTHLLTYQDQETGAFGFYDGDTFIPDADSSGLALAALAAMVDSAADAGSGGAGGSSDGSDALEETASAAVAVRDHLIATQQEDGSWAGFSPANTTGVVGSAVRAVEGDAQSAVEWLRTQQGEDGGLPAEVDGDVSDVLATAQGGLLFTGESYLSVGAGGIDRVSLPAGRGTPEPSPTEEPTQEPGESPTEAPEEPETTEPGGADEPTDTPTSDATEEPTATPAPDSGADATQDDGDQGGLGAWVWVIAALVLALAAGAVLVLTRRRGASSAQDGTSLEEDPTRE